MRDQVWNPIRRGDLGLETAPFEAWLAPMRWKVPRQVRVCTVADLFDPDVTLEAQASAFAVMAASPFHRFRVVTEYPYRMLGVLSAPAFWEVVRQAFPAWLRLAGIREAREVDLPLPNVELGAWDGQLDDRIGAAMRAVPAWRRFIIDKDGRETVLGPEGETCV